MQLVKPSFVNLECYIRVLVQVVVAPPSSHFLANVSLQQNIAKVPRLLTPPWETGIKFQAPSLDQAAVSIWGASSSSWKILSPSIPVSLFYLNNDIFKANA